MRYFILINTLVLSCAVSPAAAAPLVSVGTQYMLNTNQPRRIPIMVSSAGESVQGINLYVQVGDGGVINGGTMVAPNITNLDVIGPGTIFNASNSGTGNTPLYLGAANQSPYLIATAQTSSDAAVAANGVLAWLTVNPVGATPGQIYSVSLQNVGGNTDAGASTTDFAGVAASFAPSDAIQIVSLHDSKWTAGGNGNWNDANWSNPTPPVPNYTANAVIDTPNFVHVTSAQEANSLALSNGGSTSIDVGGSLAVTNGITVASGSSLHVEGTLSAQAVTLNDTLSLANGGNAILGDVAGSGNIAITGASSLVANSVRVHSLTIGGGGVTPASMAAGATTGSVVPEPSTILLLLGAAATAVFWRWVLPKMRVFASSED